jgi:calcium permeable stress-gated cation channel
VACFSLVCCIRLTLTTVVDFAELNAPPMINYGVVYPQAILMFVITLLYSVVYPLIVVFGSIYFGMAYVVYKYKLLFGE